jgi:Glycosyltransferase Family 4
MGDAEQQVVDLAVALPCKGYEVAVACSVAGELSNVLGDAGIPARPQLSGLAKRRLSVAYAWRLRRLLRRERFDLVHAHIYASTVAAAIATLGTGVPLVITEHTESVLARAARALEQPLGLPAGGAHHRRLDPHRAAPDREGRRVPG